MVSFPNPLKRTLGKIDSDLEETRPEHAPDFDKQTDDDNPARLTRQQKEDWAEAISRSLTPQTVRRYLDVLWKRRLTILPPLTERQKRRLEVQLTVVGVAEYKIIRRATDYAGGRTR